MNLSLWKRFDKISTSAVITMIILFLIVLGTAQAGSHLHLYADGSHILMNLLVEQTIFSPISTKFIANSIQQFLPLA